MDIHMQRIRGVGGSTLGRIGAWLRPLDVGPQEIRAMDGLRAIAALLVVTYHIIGVITINPTVFGHPAHFAWQYMATGVHLFFVLSGFLLFLPYTRAMLQGAPLPSVSRFYNRRAARILPAYYVCIALLVTVNWQKYNSPSGLANVGVHLLFLQDISAKTIFAIDGPFWTLAAEWQFYVALPLIALCISRFVGSSRSATRVIFGVISLIAFAFLVREGTAFIVAHLGKGRLQGDAYWWADRFVRVIFGFQGKFLEVFAVGMLCAVLYVITIEQRRWNMRLVRTLGPFLIVIAFVSAYVIATESELGLVKSQYVYTDLSPTNFFTIAGSWLYGMIYGALVLGVLFCTRQLRVPFEVRSLRYVGLWSYSLYLWHAPAVWGQLPFTATMPLIWRVLCGLTLSYLSYQLIERPVLQWRRGSGSRKLAPVSAHPPVNMLHPRPMAVDVPIAVSPTLPTSVQEM